MALSIPCTFIFSFLLSELVLQSSCYLLKTGPYKHRQVKFIPSLVRNTFFNAQLKKKRDLGELINSGLCFRKRNLTARKLISVLIFMAVHYVSGVLAVLQVKNKSC